VEASGFLLPKEYFNVVKEVDDKQVIQNTANEVMLVNRDFYLSSDYVPTDLVIPDVIFAFGKQDVEKAYLRKAAADALEKMFAASGLDNCRLIAVSGYRSYKRQEELFNEKVDKTSEIEAMQWVAIPGTSEHQTGLTMDILSDIHQDLDQDFDKTADFAWLQDYAYLYGFILRYPKGKEDITGYNYEPWHYRFVGVDIANKIYKSQLTLEEFIDRATAQ